LVKRNSARPVAVLSKSGAGLVINARRFHEELEGAFDDYKQDLMHVTPSKARDDRRSAFIRKMDVIARHATAAGVSGVVQP
jgi:hypothetical protein